MAQQRRVAAVDERGERLLVTALRPQHRELQLWTGNLHSDQESPAGRARFTEYPVSYRRCAGERLGLL